MSKYIKNVTDSLTNLISELSNNPSLFLKNSKTDFTRNRKIDFKTFIGITMNSSGGTMSKELLDYFDFNTNTPSVSAYTQQCSKVLPEAFEYLFHSFTQENITSVNKFKGYRLPIKSKETYSLRFKIVRFAISENSYEMLVTNLDNSEFSTKDLKKIYLLRWGIETSFRELKYAIGLTNFHARKVDYIKQEVFARLLLYNYCELITTHVIQQMKNKDKTKQVNFTIAIYICREFLRNKRNLSPPDVIKLIEKYVLPIRPGRKDPRKVNPQASVSFLYRVA